jgi:hypothetical protein
MHIIGFPTTAFDILVEYTRIMPWVYSNFVQTQTYENDGEYLGHYLGDNSDQLFINLHWRFSSTLQVQAYLDYTRKGGHANIERQYELPSLPFLYGEVTYHVIQGVSFEYFMYRDLSVHADFNVGDIRYSGENSSWKIALQYGH